MATHLTAAVEPALPPSNALLAALAGSRRGRARDVSDLAARLGGPRLSPPEAAELAAWSRNFRTLVRHHTAIERRLLGAAADAGTGRTVANGLDELLAALDRLTHATTASAPTWQAAAAFAARGVAAAF